MSELNLQKEEQYIVSSKSLEPLFAYLQSRPYGEVAKLVNDFAGSLKLLAGDAKEDANS